MKKHFISYIVKKLAFFKILVNNKLFRTLHMKVVANIICIVCNSAATVVEETRYNGLRGICCNCGGNWPES